MKVRITGGANPYEGNVEIYHAGVWGAVCDDSWEIEDGRVVCVQLGLSDGALKVTTDSRFGLTSIRFWMDNVECTGHELFLNACRFDGWSRHDCGPSEAAGVVCRQPTTTTSTTTAIPFLERPVRDEPKVFVRVKTFSVLNNFNLTFL